MRLKFFLCFAIMALSIPAQASKKDVLPDGCGNNKSEFQVTVVSSPAAVPPLADEKARIYFLEKFNKPALTFTIVTRFGIDGKWVGATKHNTYFYVDVPAGEHQLCGSVKGKRDYVGMQTLKTEAGKTYYWEANYAILFGSVQVVSTPNGISTRRPSQIETGFSLVDEDEGRFRVKSGDFVTSTEQHEDDPS